jgi:hypothetical protein
VFIWKVDLSTVRAVLTMTLATAPALLLVNILTSVYGFMYGPRKTAGTLRRTNEGDEYERASE